jgi:hypothetical protein
MTSNHGVLCPRCAEQNLPEATVCRHCGYRLRRDGRMTARAPSAPVTAGDIPAGVDDAHDEPTRLLCAAAHRRWWFAEAIIRLYLVEEVGAVPPSPGLKAAAVLRDAVAAHFRRRVVDVTVLILLAALTLLDPLAVVVWIAVAVAVRLRFPTVALTGRRRFLAAVGVAALLGLVVAAKAGTGLGLPLGDRTWWPSLAIAVAILAVLTADQYVGMRSLRRRFRPGTFVSDRRRSTSAGERWLRGLGARPFEAQLRRIADADEYAADGASLVDVIVHRTPTPFVGAGFRLPTQPVNVMAEQGGAGKPIDVVALHRHVAADLRRHHPDTDGDAADQLLHRTQVVVSAEQLVRLVRSNHSPFANQVFGDLNRPPTRRLPTTDVEEVVRQRVDGARYYSVFRAESWNRSLVVSVYLHIRIKYGTVEINVTPCVLPPLHGVFEEVDEVVHAGHGWLMTGAADLLNLPVTTVSRQRRLRRALRPLTPRRRRLRHFAPQRFGAGRSLREGVSRDVESEHWYEAGDAEGTAAAISRRVFSAIAPYLKEHGYNVSQLQDDGNKVINTYTLNIHGGKFTDTTIASRDIFQTIRQSKDDDAGD